MQPFNDLLEKYAVVSVEKQLKLGELIGDSNWEIDLETGAITFGNGHTFPIQVLGTEAYESNTWLWGWANEMSDIPEALLFCCESLRKMGTIEGIEELSEPELDLEKVTGVELALVAAGICQADAYYCGKYEGGAAFVLLDAPVLRSSQRDRPDQIINTFVTAISQIKVDQQRAFRNFLTQKAFEVEQDGDMLTAHKGATTILAKLDNQGRVAEISTQITSK